MQLNVDMNHYYHAELVIYLLIEKTEQLAQ